MNVSDSSCRILAGLLEARTGQQLTMSRRWRLETALSSLLRERGISNLDELITILVMGKEPALASLVVEALLNNETYFFRDRVPFDSLQAKMLAELAEARKDKRTLRIWSAGCSTGQEAYSLAMLFAEQPLKWQGWNIEIVGTDVSGQAIRRAREGSYSQFEVQRGLGVTQMIRWFEEMATNGGPPGSFAARFAPPSHAGRGVRARLRPTAERAAGARAARSGCSCPRGPGYPFRVERDRAIHPPHSLRWPLRTDRRLPRRGAPRPQYRAPPADAFPGDAQGTVRIAPGPPGARPRS